MSEWRLAKSLVKLRNEIEAKYPGTIVWTIGDADHQDSWSDHNPNECCDVVCAVDVKRNAGFDLADFVAHLIKNPHPNLRYVIYRRKIYQRKNGFAAEDYHGKNAHDDHAHVSSGNGPDGRSTSGYDSTKSWRIADMGNGSARPSVPAESSTKPNNGTKKLGDKMPTIQNGNRGARVRMLQGLLLAWGHSVKIDGVFGPKTEKAVRAFQAEFAKPVDGIVGAITWNKLLGL